MPWTRIVRAAVTTWLVDWWPGALVGSRALGDSSKVQYLTVI